jgi:hypothetical protein
MESQATPENKQKKKTGCIICRIMRWFFIVVLGLLLAIGLYFQAPWKILTVLAIVLASLTIVPKIVRKWVWLGFAVAVMAVIVWIFIPQKDDGQWKPYTLDKEIAKFNAQYAIPDQGNAASLYESVISKRDWEELKNKLYQLDPNEKTAENCWTAGDFPQLAKMVESIDPQLNTIRQASQKESCRFNIIPSFLYLDEDMKRNSAFRCWTYLLRTQSKQNCNLQKQIEDAIVIMRMGAHLAGQPIIIDFLSGLAVTGIGRDDLKNMIMNPALSPQQLNTIENALQQSRVDVGPLWPQIIDCEKIGVKSLYAMMYEIHPSGKFRLAHNYYQNLIDITKTDPNGIYRQTGFQKKMYCLMMWLVLPSKPDRVFQMIDDAYQPFYKIDWPNYLNTKPSQPFDIMAQLQKLSFYQGYWNLQGCIESAAAHTQSMAESFRHMLLQGETIRKGCLLVCALKRYQIQNQVWPQKLEDLLPGVPEEVLTDPASKDRFIYKPHGPSFILYSKGFDNIDTGGESKTIFDPNKLSTTHMQDDILIWPEKIPEIL